MYSKQFIEAVKQDEMARKAIEATRAFLYGHYRDWTTIGRDGKLVFENDDAATAYLALSAMLETTEAPDLGDARVDVGGVTMSASAVQMLTDVMRR